jgi:hypothetical protein
LSRREKNRKRKIEREGSRPNGKRIIQKMREMHEKREGGEKKRRRNDGKKTTVN